MKGLRASGPGAERWDDQAYQLFKSLPEMSEMECFIAGCAAVLEFDSAATFEQRRREIEALAGYRAWTGGKLFTPPQSLPSGGVAVALALYRPD